MTVGSVIQWTQDASRARSRCSLIGLSGKMGAGKDLVAALLRMHGYRRFSFGDCVRTEVLAHIERQPDTMFRGVTAEAACSKPLSDDARKLLQWWGTDYRRAEDPDYWVSKIRDEVSQHSLAVISDVRFDNEAALVRQRGGQIWRITRPATQSNGFPGHVSEALAFDADLEIENDGCAYQLAEKVLAAVRSEFGI